MYFFLYRRLIELLIGILPDSVYQSVLLISKEHDDLFDLLSKKDEEIDWENFEYEEEEEN